MTPVVQVSGLNKTYVLGEGRVEALRGVDLTLQPGEFVAVMGPSGSGKSTFMQIVGLLDTPTAGTYAFEGTRRLASRSDARADIRSRRLGFVFQAYNLLPRTTALENVELPMVYAGVPEAERRRIALEKMEIVGVAHLAEHHSEPDVRRTAAARRDRALARQQSGAHPRRRADGRARHENVRTTSCVSSPGSTTSTALPSCSSPTSPTSPRTRGGSSPSATGCIIGDVLNERRAA